MAKKKKGLKDAIFDIIFSECMNSSTKDIRFSTDVVVIDNHIIVANSIYSDSNGIVDDVIKKLIDTDILKGDV